MSLSALRGLLDSLASGIRSLQWNPRGTEWGDYYQDTNYVPAAFKQKEELVARFMQEIAPKTVWDFGANTGVFSRVAAQFAEHLVAFDMDPAAVEKHYRECRTGQDSRILPLVMDLTNPSANLGWANAERDSLLARGPVDAVLALALLHHLAIGNNLPFPQIASFFRQCGRWLVIEFIPKDDSQVQRLLASREDIFPHYTREDFEHDFSQYFQIMRCEPIENSLRLLYLMKRG